MRPAAVAEQRERGGELPAAQRRGEVGELGVGEVAQVAHHRPAVAGEHVGRVGQVHAAVLDGGGVGHRVAQAVQRAVEGGLRHGKAPLAGAGEEVGDVGGQPRVAGILRGPRAEGAARILTRQNPPDRRAHPLVEPAVEAELLAGRQRVDVEERHRPADDLLRAAVGVAVEGLQQGGDVDAPDAVGRDGDRAGAGQDVGEQVRRQVEAGAGLQRAQVPAHQRAGAGIDPEGEGLAGAALDAGAGQADVEPGRAGAGGGDRDHELPLGAGLQPHRGVHRLARHHDGAGEVEIDRVVAGRALDVVEGDEEARAVADIEEARQGAGEDHGVAHDHVSLRLAHAALRPGGRHQPGGAVEGGQVQRNFCCSVGAHRDHARVEGERRLCRRRVGEFGRAAVAAGADRAERALHAVDQVAVEVADLGAEGLLAEEVGKRVRRLVAGQVEDADIDRGQRHPRLLAGTEPGDLHRNGEGAAGAHLFRRLDRHREAALLLVDREPRHPERPARHPLGGLVERAVGGGDEVGARAPFRLDRDLDGGAALRHRHVADLVHPVADDGQRRRAGELRCEPRPQPLARGVGRLVEGEVEQIGHVGGLGAAPADGEGHARRRLRLARHARLQAVLAEAHRHGDARGRLRAGRHPPVGDAAARLHRFEAPAPVGAVPLIGPLDLRQRPGHAVLREAPAVGGGHDHVEGGRRVLGEIAAEILADRQHGLGRQDRQGDAAAQRPAARLADGEGDLRFQRARRGHLLHRHGDGGLALRVGGGLAVDLRRRRLHGLVVEADGKAVQALDAGGGRGLDRDRARDVEPRARRAVEVARGDVDDRRLAAGEARRLRGEAHLQPLGHVILDEPARFADRRRLRIGIGRDPPRAVHRARHQRQGERAPAEPFVGHRRAAILDAVGPPHHQSQRQAAHRRALRVAQKSRELHRLAGAVDAALGEDVRLRPARRRAALHAAVGQVEGAEREVEEAVIVAELRHDEARRQPALAAGEAGGEGGVALAVGLGDREHVVVAGDQPDLGAGDRLGARERAGEDVDAVAALEGGEAKVGDHEPLRRLRLVAAVLLLRRIRGAGGFGQHQIEAGLQLADRLQHGEGGHRLAVGLGLGRVEGALPDALALLVGDRLGRRAVELAQELFRAERGQQAAVADAQHLHVEGGRVDRDQRHARLSGAGQDVVAAGEAHLGRAVADVDLVIGRFQQALADGGGQALAHHEGVALGMLEAVDADLGALRRDGGVGRARDGDVGGVIGLRDEALREGEADPRRGGVRIDLVVEDAEAVLRAQALVGRAGLRLVPDREARPVGLQRRPPLGLGRLDLAEPGERPRLVRRILGAEVALVGGGARAALQLEPGGIIGALLVVARRVRGAGVVEPVANIVRVGRDGGGVGVQLGIRLGPLAPRGDLRLAAPLRGRLSARGRLALQRGLEPDARAREVLAQEGFGDGRGRRPRRRSRARRLGQGGEAEQRRADQRRAETPETFALGHALVSSGRCARTGAPAAGKLSLAAPAATLGFGPWPAP
ncbi:hypothetical protein CHKEEEPN_2936 [Methylorubrum podarium]|nr:hypothetical protein CHKEEEPN_2936 [Methylorubrum podarium]